MFLRTKLKTLPDDTMFSLGLTSGSGYFFIGTKSEFYHNLDILNNRVKKREKKSKHIDIENRKVREEYLRETDDSTVAFLITNHGGKKGPKLVSYWLRSEILKDNDIQAER